MTVPYFVVGSASVRRLATRHTRLSRDEVFRNDRWPGASGWRSATPTLLTAPSNLPYTFSALLFCLLFSETLLWSKGATKGSNGKG